MKVICSGHIFYPQELNENGEWETHADYYKGCVLVKSRNIYIVNYKDLLILPGLSDVK